MKRSYEAIVIGVSSGGMPALKTLLPALPADFPVPLIVVQHTGAYSGNYWIHILDGLCKLSVKEADEKEYIVPGTVYAAPPGYHLLIETDRSFSLSISEKINYARPSVDVLFESAADVYSDRLIGLILSGANHDGAAGLKRIKQLGGLAIVQNPSDAESPMMPASAIAAVVPDYILPLRGIADLLQKLTMN